MRRKSKKQKSLKFYLCLLGILAGIYLVLVAILAIRNPADKNNEAVSSSVSTEAAVQETEKADISPDISTPDNEKDKQAIAPKKQTEDDLIQEKEPQDQKAETADDYGRGKERYTAFDAEDIFTKVNVKIVNEKEMRAVTGASFDTVKSYLNTYASHNEIDATRCRMLAHQYIGHYGDRIEIYMRFNDENKTLVTVIYEPANATHSSHVDVVPCQYTVKEIKKISG